uniref:Uncharacterized protein n=1 Tax=Aquila chrysaetos chrysaetos TaxID=223781 RepID=A0A663FD32_AQUCH
KEGEKREGRKEGEKREGRKEGEKRREGRKEGEKGRGKRGGERGGGKRRNKGEGGTGRDGHSAGHPDQNSPVPSRRRSTAGRRAALCSSSRPGAGINLAPCSPVTLFRTGFELLQSHIHTFAPCIT